MERVLRSQKRESVPQQRKRQNNLTQADYNDLESFLQIAKETGVTRFMLLEQCRQYGLGRCGNKKDLIQKLETYLPLLKQNLNARHEEFNFIENSIPSEQPSTSGQLTSSGEHSSSEQVTTPGQLTTPGPSTTSGQLTTPGPSTTSDPPSSRHSTTSWCSANSRNPLSYYDCSEFEDGETLKEERDQIVLFRKPFLTLQYFFKEIGTTIYTYSKALFQYWNTVLIGCLLLIMWFILIHINGPHQPVFQFIQGNVLWSLYWLGLGVLSSVGLGTGLHTFLLYLGPHIGKVTVAAYECGSLNFPEPPYPNRIICPPVIDRNYVVTIWNIINKVKLEALMWGAGTALGELPPYFMARASRLSEFDDDDDEMAHLNKRIKNRNKKLTVVDRCKLFVEKFVHKMGFFGILACASIPNPLFDLAGITCGNFLIPFRTFFLATLIGKSVIKISIQVIVVIIAFNEVLIAKLMTHLVSIPFIGSILQELISEMLIKEKIRLHHQFESKDNVNFEGSVISKVFEIFVISTVIYFVVSIINSMAQNHHKRLHKSNAKCL